MKIYGTIDGFRQNRFIYFFFFVIQGRRIIET